MRYNTAMHQQPSHAAVAGLAELAAFLFTFQEQICLKQND